MKKTTLKDMKKRNMQLILECITQSESLSRTELAEKSGLSLSTISMLVNDLLGEGILCEAGEDASTGGRKRIQIKFNETYALMIIIHIKGDGTYLRAFNMHINEVAYEKLTSKPVYGNDFLEVINKGIKKLFASEPGYSRRIAGIGLLFQENLDINDFIVTYSTGVSSAAISLEDAIKTNFRVPVVIDYSSSYTLTGMGNTEALQDNENKLFIRIGRNILASVVINEKTLEVNGEKTIDLTPLFPEAMSLKEGKAEKGKKAEGIIKDAMVAAYSKSVDINSKNTIKQLAQILKPLCLFFSIKSIYFSGEAIKDKQFLENISRAFSKEFISLAIPKLKYENKNEEEIYLDLALKLRNKQLNII